MSSTPVEQVVWNVEDIATVTEATIVQSLDDATDESGALQPLDRSSDCVLGKDGLVGEFAYRQLGHGQTQPVDRSLSKRLEHHPRHRTESATQLRRPNPTRVRAGAQLASRTSCGGSPAM